MDDVITCTTFLFEQNGVLTPCSSISGNLFLVFSQGAGTLGPVRMAQGLATLGLRDLTVINGSLTIINVQTSGKLEVNTTFLPQLRSVYGTISVSAVSLFPDPPSFPLFSSLPLQSVRFAGSLAVQNTGFTDMNTFGGLECVSRGMTIANNNLMESLAGLNQLQYIDPENRVQSSSLTIFGHPVLESPGQYAQLSLVAGCGSLLGAPPNAINITVPGCPTPMLSYPELCAYLTSSNLCPGP